jgi:hypothetical protein
MWDTVYVLLCIFAGCFGIAVAGAMFHGILKHLWMVFRWRVLGWQPAIYNKELVEQVSEAFADKCARRDLAQSEGDDGCKPDDEWMREHKEDLKELARYAILWYVNFFSIQKNIEASEPSK